MKTHENDDDFKITIVKRPEAKKEVKPSNVYLIEKYRPSFLSDIVDQEQVVALFKRSMVDHNLPHLIFYGPPGTGKTSAALAGVRDIFGDELYKSRVIEMNASNERGIGTVRQKIKLYARSSVKTGGQTNIPPYKVIILDEADTMTVDAQAAIRKIIEDNSAVSRFIFICNHVDKISDPIKSRCAIFKFAPISGSLMFDRIKYIAEKEKIEVSSEALKIIVEMAQGDMRKAIMTLQNVKYYLLYSESLPNDNVKKTTLEIGGFCEDSVYEAIFEQCLNKDVFGVMHLAGRIYRDGHAIDTILTKLCLLIIHTKKLTDQQKALITINCGSIKKRLTEGSDEFLELSNFLLTINKFNCK